MKAERHLTYMLLMFVFAFAIASCDVQDKSVDSFADVADRIPNFSAIDGADNVTVRVNRNNDVSYFDVKLSNIQGDYLFEGDYKGWCAHWSAPINTRGQEYEGVTLYSTLGDKNWDKLNYLLNHRQHFMDTIEGATYKEIQAVIWDLIEFKEFDVNTNPVFDNFNKEAFIKILRNVRERGSIFRFRPGMIYAVFADMSVNPTDGKSTQTVIVERGETAWGGDLDGKGTRFYSIFVLDDDETQEITAGRNREKIGDITASVGDGVITFSIEFDPYWVLKDDGESVKVKGKNGDTPPVGLRPSALSPGNNNFTEYRGEELVFTVPVFDYYLIHLDVRKLLTE